MTNLMASKATWLTQIQDSTGHVLKTMSDRRFFFATPVVSCFGDFSRSRLQ